MSEPGLDYASRTNEVKLMQSLIGEKLEYEDPLEQGKTTVTVNGINLNFEKEWSNGTDWVTFDAKWIVRAAKRGKIISVEAT